MIALTNQQTFYPLLAEAMLDLRLPASPEPATLPDDRPALATRLRTAFADAAAGRPVTHASADVAGQLASPFARALLNGVGPLEAVSLVGEAEGQRRYRVRFARKAMTWIVVADADDWLTMIRPE